MPAPSLDKLVEAAGELGALPDSWQRIDTVLARPSASTEQIADSLASDPGLSARMLKLANSPMFGLMARVDSLPKAVHLIGTRQLRELALAATVIDMVSNGRRERVEGFLRHAMAVALHARAIAGLRRESNVERFFVAGLLHDLGSLAMELAAPDLVAETRRRASATPEPVELSEAAVFGYDHAAVGAAIVERWRLPAPLREAVGCHHAPMRANAHRLDAAIIHVSTIATGLTGYGADGPVMTPLHPAAWELCGVEAKDLAQLDLEVERSIGPLLGILAGAAS
jgi:putative nucleotidyltransferase with HDIG domain